MFGVAPAPKTLSDLSRDLQDIRKKLLPLAESSWTLFKKQIGTGSKSKAKAADKADKAQTTSEERVVMFDEFASIESLLRWNGNVRTGDQVCPKAVDFDFSVDASTNLAPSPSRWRCPSSSHPARTRWFRRFERSPACVEPRALQRQLRFHSMEHGRHPGSDGHRSG